MRHETSNEMVRLVLGFDSDCMTCSGVAQRIAAQFGARIELRSLSDQEMVHWRSEALGDNAPWTPTLVQIQGEEIKAWTGLSMGAQLARVLGPAEAWRLLRLLGQDTPAAANSVFSGHLSRRRVLRGFAGGLAALLAMPVSKSLTQASERLTSLESRHLSHATERSFSVPETEYVEVTEEKIVTDFLGTRRVQEGEYYVAETEPPFDEESALTELPEGCGVDVNPRVFWTYLDDNWYELVCRTCPFQGSAIQRAYYPGQAISVTAETYQGQFICRGWTYGYGSSVWYRTSAGCWIWSGGTQHAVWNRSC